MQGRSAPTKRPAGQAEGPARADLEDADGRKGPNDRRLYRKDTLECFVKDHADPRATIYTDDHKSNVGLPNHQSVRHCVGEYVRGQAHTNSVETLQGMLQCGHYGTFHKTSPKHLDRYVQEFASRQSVREADTVDHMGGLVAGTPDKRLTYRALIAPYGLRSGVQAF